jgi:hypothetical protein
MYLKEADHVIYRVKNSVLLACFPVGNGLGIKDDEVKEIIICLMELG